MRKVEEFEVIVDLHVPFLSRMLPVLVSKTGFCCMLSVLVADPCLQMHWNILDGPMIHSCFIAF